VTTESEYFNHWLSKFDDTITEAVRVSVAASGRQGVDRRLFWASALFTRICTSGVSLLSLTPTSRFAGKLLSHYDSSGASALARSVLDACLMFFYLCIDDVADHERDARFKAVYLHDCMSRYRLFRDLGLDDPELTAFKRQADDLKAELMQVPSIAHMPSKQRASIFRGERWMLIPRTKLLERMGSDPRQYRAIYGLLSSHVHNGPMTFMRMEEGDRGRGVESDFEKGRIGLALEVSDGEVGQAIRGMSALFPDIPTR